MPKKQHFKIDPVHSELDFSNDPLIADVTRDKYLWQDEDFNGLCKRVTKAVFAKDEKASEYQPIAEEAMQKGILMPGGRIIAGAGTSKVVTLMNCYVNHTLEDSMQHIMSSVSKVALTLQQGGGIGTNFQPLRPKGAILKRTGPGSAASGPLPFMEMWNATSSTVRSAGDRRGAMMGTLGDTHPDLPTFITYKQTPDTLTQFNISILISDAFMEAVALDEDWLLYFNVEPAEPREPDLIDEDFEDHEGVKQYVYSKWKARELWELITSNTYNWSEPGLIFIDRVNDLNNLQYCEDIQCTNPCGEQPLPPDGVCNLSAINLNKLVKNPFTNDAHFDYETLDKAVAIAIRFLDNVIDVSRYPFPEQEQEQFNKRRLGLGISGLADALNQLRIRYGSVKSVPIVESIMKRIAVVAYETSAMLADEKGAFPLFDKEEYANAPFIQKLPKETQDMIYELGLRNGVLLTIAPTGTTTVTFGNGSSGLEPNFGLIYNRNVYQPDGTWKQYKDVKAYGLLMYEHVVGGVEYSRDKNGVVHFSGLPDYFATAQDLEVIDHLRIQAACQKWVDASVSKTINVPEDYPYEDFVDVYRLAYDMGAKGCTTYRPSDVRGSILSVGNASKEEQVELMVRPDVLTGATYKIKWPSWSASLYLTINQDEHNRPYEIFIQSKDARHQEFITALTLMISGIFRRGGDVAFVPRELSQVVSTHDGAWQNMGGKGKYYTSIIAKIADVITMHFQKIGILPSDGISVSDDASDNMLKDSALSAVEGLQGEICPVCKAPAVVREEGCKVCKNCGDSSCG